MSTDPTTQPGSESGDAVVEVAETVSTPGYHDGKSAHLARLKRIEGQVRGIAKMVEDDRYCIDILTQVSAVRSALHSVALGLMDDHMAHCVVEAARHGGQEQEIKLQEVSDAVARLVKS